MADEELLNEEVVEEEALPDEEEESGIRICTINPQGTYGIRYLDAGSRGTGTGTRNFVVFDDSLVTIKDRK